MTPIVASAMDHMVRDRHRSLRATRSRRSVRSRRRLRSWLGLHLPAGPKPTVSGRDVVLPEDVVQA
jgi:hypothetical protein